MISRFLRLLPVFVLLLSSGCITTKLRPLTFELERVPRGKDAFYEKHVSCRGFPVLSSAKVPDQGLYEAAYLIDQMLANRPDILRAMIRSKTHMTVMAEDEFVTDVPEYSYMRPKRFWNRRARGLGPTERHPCVSVGVENLLQYPGDPYEEENILVHEFAHAIHYMGLNRMDKSFDVELERLFEQAKEKGLWKGKYAGTNRAEYWAEAVQSYFGDNRENDHDHNHVNTRAELMAYDPDMAALVNKVFRGSKWQFAWPKDRADQPHLAGYDWSKSPSFVWPAEFTNWWNYEKGPFLEPQVPSVNGHRSTGSEKQLVYIFLLNQSNAQRHVYWIDYDGEWQQKRILRHGDHLNVGSYSQHPWLVTDANDKPLQVYYPHPDRLIGVIR